MGKKTSAVKSSDKTKAWYKRAQKGYQIGSRRPNKRFLIFCEGQSEESYFNSFPVMGIQVKCVDMQGRSKLAMVRKAQEYIKAENREDNVYDEIWCVFDMDFKQGGKELADFDTAISQAAKYKYKVAYSNDAYELWYYLHYQHTDIPNNRTFYYSELSKLWNINYVKDGKKKNECQQVYNRLQEDDRACQIQAIERAKQLHLSQIDQPFHKQNPVTTIYKLVENLNEYLAR